MFRFLSHVIGEQFPVYGKMASAGSVAVRSLSQGDSANVTRITLETHWGTHVDTPRHFFDGGRSISDYSADELVFSRSATVSVSLEDHQVLDDIGLFSAVDPESDIVLLNSGWCHKRGADGYFKSNPGIAPELAAYLRSEFLNLRAVGIDWISVSPICNRVLGREAHRILLDPQGDREPLLIIEDMDFSGGLEGLQELFVVPLRIEHADGAPCTVMGRFE